MLQPLPTTATAPLRVPSMCGETSLPLLLFDAPLQYFNKEVKCLLVIDTGR